MDFSLAVFWNTFVLKHSFGEKNLKKKSFFLEKVYYKCNVHRSFSANSYKAVYPTENTLTIEISFESEFYGFL